MMSMTALEIEKNDIDIILDSESHECPNPSFLQYVPKVKFLKFVNPFTFYRKMTQNTSFKMSRKVCYKEVVP